MTWIWSNSSQLIMTAPLKIEQTPKSCSLVYNSLSSNVWTTLVLLEKALKIWSEFGPKASRHEEL
jgi:hypothetical protein